MKAKGRVGIDFDNTIVTYEEVFRSAAVGRGLIDRGFSGPKQAIRDRIRLLPDGEQAWMKLQGHVYGKGIAEATMFAGVAAFLSRCRAEKVPVVIVSHKTEYGHYDPERVNLREAALAWMREQGFFAEVGYGIPVGNVYFEGTRAEKIQRISSTGCSIFIDDLEEVLNDPEFPPSVTRILFSDAADLPATAPYAICRTWSAVEEQVFERA